MRVKTINCLIMHNKGCVDKKDIDECIAWLEQKEQKPILKFRIGDTIRKKTQPAWIKQITSIFEDKTYITGIGTDAYGIKVSEQDDWELVEQKPAEWNPEDEQNLNVCLSYIKDEPLRNWLKDAIIRGDKLAWNDEDEKNSAFIVAALDAYAWLRKERNHTSGQEGFEKAVSWIHNRLGLIRPQPKSVWSEEDERIIKDVCSVLDSCGRPVLASRLKSICPQPKQEWSEEDERIKSCIGLALTDVDEQRFKDFRTTLKDCLAFLKRIRPSWKPSD